MTKQQFIQARNNQYNVMTLHPTEKWQQVGYLETMKDGIVTIRWHNNDHSVRTSHRPVTEHKATDVVIGWPQLKNYVRETK